MKKRKNTMAKIVAGIALISILIGVVGTGLLVIVNSFTHSWEEISAEEIQQYLDTLSGTTLSEEGSTPLEDF